MSGRRRPAPVRVIAADGTFEVVGNNKLTSPKRRAIGRSKKLKTIGAISARHEVPLEDSTYFISKEILEDELEGLMQVLLVKRGEKSRMVTDRRNGGS